MSIRVNPWPSFGLFVLWSLVSPLPRAYNKTQRIILDGLMAQAVEHSGGTDNVTIEQFIGIKEMLENEFTLAAALPDDE